MSRVPSEGFYLYCKGTLMNFNETKLRIKISPLKWELEIGRTVKCTHAAER